MSDKKELRVKQFQVYFHITEQLARSAGLIITLQMEQFIFSNPLLQTNRAHLPYVILQKSKKMDF